jgi:hypothetical protein
LKRNFIVVLWWAVPTLQIHHIFGAQAGGPVLHVS